MSVSVNTLSASTSGRFIQVTGTSATTLTLLHTAITGSAQLDEVFMYATNTGANSLTLTMQFGGSLSGDFLVISIPSKDGLYQIIPGLPLQGGSAINCFAQSGNFINIGGYVQRGP